MRLTSALWDSKRAETIYWWDSETTPPHRHHPVCQKPPVSFCLLSRTADHLSALNTGVNQRARDVPICALPSWFIKEVRGQTQEDIYLNRLWPGGFEQTLARRLLPVNKAAWSWGYIWCLGRDTQPGISSLLVHPLALAACSRSVQHVNILLLSLCETSKLLTGSYL